MNVNVTKYVSQTRRNVKYNRFVAIRCAFSSSKYSKTRFPPGLCHGPSWGIHDAPMYLLVGWGGGQPLAIPFPPRRLQLLDLGAFSASLVRSPTHIPGYAHDRVGAHIAPTHRPDLFKESNKYKLGNCMVADVCIY